MFATLKAYIYGAIAAVILAACAMLWYQGSVIDRLRGDKAQLATDVLKCAAANVENQSAIAQLVRERDKSGLSCELRLSIKDATIKKMREICETVGGNDGQTEGKTPVVGVDTIGNSGAMVELLDGMLPVVSADGGGAGSVRQAAGTSGAAGADIFSGELGYCVNEDGAMRLMTNVLLLRAWALDMQSILTSIQTGTKI